ncbi:MAG: metallophosphoesterase [Magnetococcales bacterium]|nr:metallophosphoesterase [Magnetococcales bacterium]
MSSFRFPTDTARALILQAIPESLNTLDDAASGPLIPYLPAAHARALDPRQALVEGMRGSGKSFWYFCLLDPTLRAGLVRQREDFPLGPSIKIYPGFGEATRQDDYPDKELFSELAQQCSPDDVWRAIIAHHFLEADQIPPLSGWEERVRWIRDHGEEMSRALVELEQRLASRKEQRLILFDALDRTADQWHTMRRMASRLLSLLLEFRSFRCLHLKVFARPDLLSDPDVTAFPDSSKLIANKECLTWPPRDLYNLLWHLLSNARDGEWFRETCEKEFGLRWSQQQGLWLVPVPMRIDEKLQKQIFHALTGPFMGEDRKRGLPSTWLTNHLEDAFGQISPRSFLSAIRWAARHERSESSLYPLSGAALRFGIVKASEVRVGELKEDFPWVVHFFHPLAGQKVPIAFEDLTRLWEQSDSLPRAKNVQVENSRGYFPNLPDLLSVRQELEKIGVFQRLKDDRVTLPDIFRLGFHIKRKGGIPAAPRRSDQAIASSAAVHRVAGPEAFPGQPWNGLSIVHLSDLHLGEGSRFAAMKPQEWGERTAASFQEILPKDHRPDLVIVTGDITNQAKPPEYVLAHEFFVALAGTLGIGRDRFVFLPGNHDVSRPLCLRVESELSENDVLTDESFLFRVEKEKFNNFNNFNNFIKKFLPPVDHVQTLERGAAIWDFPSLRLSVATLNSCEKITHRKGERNGGVSAEQVEALLTHWRTSAEERLKILALHHNPEPPGDFNDTKRVKNLVGQSCPHLLLYGHQHAGQAGVAWNWSVGGGQAVLLGAGSLGAKTEELQENETHSCQLITITAHGHLRVRPLIYDPKATVTGKADTGRFVSIGTENDYPLRPFALPKGFDGARETIQPSPPSAHAAFLTAYRQRLTDPRPRWDLSSTGTNAWNLGSNAEEASLEEMYLALRLGENDDPAILDAGAPLSPGEVLDLRRPLIIRGQAGAGKTTWIRWTFHQLLRRTDALPILVELRSLAGYWTNAPQGERSFDAWLTAWLKDRGLPGWRQEFFSLLDEPGAIAPVLLVDGWDELGELGHDFRGNLLGFLNAHPKVRCVVTSRPYGAGRPSGGDGFGERMIQPLNDEDIAALVNHFFRFAVKNPSPVWNASGFMTALERSENAREMARTALLLTLMLIVSRHSPLPEKRVDLYSECVKMLLLTLPTLRKAGGGRTRAGAWTPEDGDKRLRHVADLAHAVQSSAKGRYSQAAVSLPLEKMAALPWAQEESLEQKKGFLIWLRDSSGIFMERADNSLQFIHLSFQEYLTARHLHDTTREDSHPEIFHELAQQGSWWETLRLWAALIDKKHPPNLEPVLARLLEHKKQMFLVGTILADGLASTVIFDCWAKRWIEELNLAWDDETDIVAIYWGRSRGEERRQTLERMQHLAGKKALTWLAWIRFDLASEIMKFPPPPCVQCHHPMDGKLSFGLWC